MDRRRLLTLLAAGTAATLAGAGAARGEFPWETGSTGGTGTAPGLPRVQIGPGTIQSLPGDGNNMALTIDDGANPATVGAFIELARRTGIRLTFFVTAYYDSWLIHRDALRPLVDAGQIQLGNHSWDHPDLTKLSPGAVADQLDRAKSFLWNNFGVDGTPYYRPPYGRHNGLVDQVAADTGYTVPTMWHGTLNDTAPVISEGLLLDSARQWFNAQSIVIGHANRTTVNNILDQLLDIVRERNLQLVTLNDVIQVM